MCSTYDTHLKLTFPACALQMYTELQFTCRHTCTHVYNVPVAICTLHAAVTVVSHDALSVHYKADCIIMGILYFFIVIKLRNTIM